MFYVYMYYDLEHWWSMMSSWSGDSRESLGKPYGDIVTSPLCPKSIVVETPTTPPMTGAYHNINQAHIRPLHRSVHRGLVAT